MSQKYNFMIKNGIVKMVKNPGYIPHTQPETKGKIKKSALNGYFSQVDFMNENIKELTPEKILQKFKYRIITSLEKHNSQKVILSLTAKMRNGQQVKNMYFNTSPHIIYSWNSKTRIFDRLFKELITSFYGKDFEGSGWTLVSFEMVSLNYGKYKQFKGGCISLKLPRWIEDKKAVVSMLTGDLKCFYWAILAHFNPREKDKGRITKTLRKIAKEEPNKYADFSDVVYPVTAEGIEKFQEKNTHLNLIVLGVDNKNQKTPVIYDGETGGEKIFILYYGEHYYLISEMSRLLSSQLSKSHGRVHFCYRCQQGFKNEEKRDEHAKYCKIQHF